MFVMVIFGMILLLVLVVVLSLLVVLLFGLVHQMQFQLVGHYVMVKIAHRI
jgi:hypothetical protein